MIGGSDAITRTDAKVYCDDVSDVANLTQYAKDHQLPMGSKAIVIETGDIYLMKSSYSWKKQGE